MVTASWGRRFLRNMILNFNAWKLELISSLQKKSSLVETWMSHADRLTSHFSLNNLHDSHFWDKIQFVEDLFMFFFLRFVLAIWRFNFNIIFNHRLLHCYYLRTFLNYPRFFFGCRHRRYRQLRKSVSLKSRKRFTATRAIYLWYEFIAKSHNISFAPKYSGIQCGKICTIP